MTKEINTDPGATELFVASHDLTLGDEYIDPEYGHIRHEGFPFIFCQERERIMDERGITASSLISDWHLQAFVKNMELVYFRPVQSGEVVTIKTKVSHSSAALIFNQQMDKEESHIAAERIRYVMTNLQNNVTRIPPDLLEKLKV